MIRLTRLTVLIILSLSLVSLSLIVDANNQLMNMDLVKVVQELQSIKPLLEKAEREQDKNARVKIEFEDFMASDGEKHRGLKSDIQEIQDSIISMINDERVDPRSMSPIEGDFVNKEKS